MNTKEFMQGLVVGSFGKLELAKTVQSRYIVNVTFCLDEKIIIGMSDGTEYTIFKISYNKEGYIDFILISLNDDIRKITMTYDSDNKLTRVGDIDINNIENYIYFQ